ncbi:hypothetical protein [Oceanicola sp. 502str15]|uniref:hypothetical protein n=1 Tax=Oceanicola sp. 502str15 TaxID=2696061 RepID=UPI002095B891|nr:hypothetical protein [Oceanicola sp. 502str15]MCO6383622.1 hypothetical protein [Oceanicola sp. 502str15]
MKQFRTPLFGALCALIASCLPHASTAAPDERWDAHCADKPVRSCLDNSSIRSVFYISAFRNGTKCYLRVPTIGQRANVPLCVAVDEAELGLPYQFRFTRSGGRNLLPGQQVEISSEYQSFLQATGAVPAPKEKMRLALLHRLPFVKDIGTSVQEINTLQLLRWSRWEMRRVPNGPFVQFTSIGCERNREGECIDPAQRSAHPKADIRSILSVTPGDSSLRVRGLPGLLPENWMFRLATERHAFYPGDLDSDNAELVYTTVPKQTTAEARLAFAAGHKFAATLTETGGFILPEGTPRAFPDPFVDRSRPELMGLTAAPKKEVLTLEVQEGKPSQLFSFIKATTPSGAPILTPDGATIWRPVTSDGTKLPFVVEVGKIAVPKSEEDDAVKPAVETVVRLRVAGVQGDLGLYYCRSTRDEGAALEPCRNSTGSTFKLTWLRRP